MTPESFIETGSDGIAALQGPLITYLVAILIVSLAIGVAWFIIDALRNR